MRNKAIKDAIKIMLGTIIIGILVGSTENILRIVSSSIIGDFTNAILNGSVNYAFKDIGLLILSLGLLIFIVPILNVLDSSFMLKKSLDHDKWILNKFFKKDYLKASVYDPGEIGNRLENDTISLRYYVMVVISNPITIIITSIPLGYFLFSKSVIYGVVCIVSSLLPIAVTFITRNMEARYELKTNEYNDEKVAMERELYDNFIYIKFHNISKSIIKKLDKLFEEYYHNVLVKDITCGSAVTFFNTLCSTLSKVIVILFGVYLVSKNEITVGLIASFLGYMVSIEGIVSMISEVIGGIPQLKQDGERVSEFYIHEEVRGAEVLKDYIKEINIDNLGFSYNNEKKILDNVSFHINKGDKVLLSGSNGSGKSTFIKCLCGLYSSYNGEISVNKVNLDNIDINWWRDQIAYIEQDPFLFKGTIKENILLGNFNCSSENLESVVEKVNLNLELEKEIINNGENISGGQKQKISIARALIKEAPILVLDEPLNNLDIDTKDIIYDIIKQCNKTIIYISHDKETCNLANKIYDFNEYKRVI